MSHSIIKLSVKGILPLLMISALGVGTLAQPVLARETDAEKRDYAEKFCPFMSPTEFMKNARDWWNAAKNRSNYGEKGYCPNGFRSEMFGLAGAVATSGLLSTPTLSDMVGVALACGYNPCTRTSPPATNQHVYVASSVDGIIDALAEASRIGADVAMGPGGHIARELGINPYDIAVNVLANSVRDEFGDDFLAYGNDADFLVGAGGYVGGFIVGLLGEAPVAGAVSGAAGYGVTQSVLAARRPDLAKGPTAGGYAKAAAGGFAGGILGKGIGLIGSRVSSGLKNGILADGINTGSDLIDEAADYYHIGPIAAGESVEKNGLMSGWQANQDGLLKGGLVRDDNPENGVAIWFSKQPASKEGRLEDLPPYFQAKISGADLKKYATGAFGEDNNGLCLAPICNGQEASTLPGAPGTLPPSVPAGSFTIDFFKEGLKVWDSAFSNN